MRMSSCFATVKSRLLKPGVHQLRPYQPVLMFSSRPLEKHAFVASRTANVAGCRHQRFYVRASASISTVLQDTEGSSSEGFHRTVVLDIGNMKCGGCTASVKRLLMAKPGVNSAAVNLLTECAVIEYNSESTEEDFIHETTDLLASKGFPATVRSAEEGLAGDADEADQKRSHDLQQSLVDLGVAWSLALLCCTHHVGHWLHALGFHGVAHGPLMQAMSNPLVSGALGGFALLGPGRKLVQDGMVSLARGNPNMNSLVGMGAVTSFTAGLAAPLIPGAGLEISFLEEPVMLLSFVLLGRALEARARLKASADLKVVAKLVPAKSRLLLDPSGKATEDEAGTAKMESASVETSSLRVGDLVRVLPGERIPVDGRVICGSASADESMLTGESTLVPKTVDSKVISGTVNYEGPIVVKATSSGGDSTVVGIGRLVAAAQSREAPIQRLADSVSGIFCYSVMAAAAATAAFWVLAGNGLICRQCRMPPESPRGEVRPLPVSAGAGMFPGAVGAAGVAGAGWLGLKLGVNVLVVACPCALGLATPTAVLVASSLGARRGLLLRGGDVLERLAQLDTIVFDKTGTLTKGQLRLEEIRSNGQLAEHELLRLAAAVEAGSKHPLAEAVARAAAERGVEVPPSRASSTQPGGGVFAEVGDLQVAVGKRDWAAERTGCEASSSGSWENGGERWAGKSLVHVAVGGHGLVGCLVFQDELRDEAPEVVQRLSRLGIRSMLLSGDRRASAAAAAAQAGIAAESAFGEMRPEAKAAFVERLRQEGRRVGMVGDGINDAPALAAAHVGLALHGGLAAAADSAAVVLLGNRLGQVVEAVVLGRSTLSKIRQNLVWALAYNAIGVPIAAGALLPAYGIALNPSISGAAMAVSSIAVVLNSLLLRSKHPLPPAALNPPRKNLDFS